MIAREIRAGRAAYAILSKEHRRSWELIDFHVTTRHIVLIELRKSDKILCPELREMVGNYAASFSLMRKSKHAIQM